MYPRKLLTFISLIIAALFSGLLLVAAFFSRMLIRPARQPLWSTPADFGLAFENVEFPARDGVRLSGWFIPALSSEAQRENRPTLILLHGWPWNRLGFIKQGILHDVPGSQPINLLFLAYALHRAGYHLLMFDLRNHGDSASAPPVTFGLKEMNDLLGALDYLDNRSEVDPEQIGAVGFSMGANAILYALTHTTRLQAAVAVQPTSPQVFVRRYARQQAGPVARPLTRLTEFIYRLFGGMRFAAIEPTFTVAGADTTPILYIQGKGDPWGTVENVRHLAGQTPQASEPLLLETADRFQGYQAAIDHPELLTDFLADHLPVE